MKMLKFRIVFGIDMGRLDNINWTENGGDDCFLHMELK